MDTQKKETLKILLPMDELAELLEEMGFVRIQIPTETKPGGQTLPPVVEEPASDLMSLVNEWVGAIGADYIYVSKTEDFYYLVTTGGFIFPRGTNTSFDVKPGTKILPANLNPSPEKGGLGVPKRYQLPTGYQWRTTPGDGAFYIVKSDVIVTDGPAWLQAKPEPVKGNAGSENAGKSTGWELESDK